MNAPARAYRGFFWERLHEQYGRAEHFLFNKGKVYGLSRHRSLWFPRRYNYFVSHDGADALLQVGAQGERPDILVCKAREPGPGEYRGDPFNKQTGIVHEYDCLRSMARDAVYSRLRNDKLKFAVFDHASLEQVFDAHEQGLFLGAFTALRDRFDLYDNHDLPPTERPEKW
jgi:hypothetical protein